MSIINEQNKTRFFTSFQALVDYLMENSGIQEEDLPAILEAFLTSKLATDTDVLENTNTDRVITISTAATAARKAIEEWVQLAPESLDTLQEISTALQNDPDIIQKLFDLIAGNASKKDLDKRQLYSNIDFSSADWDGFFTWSGGGLFTKNAAIYHGVATSKRLGIPSQYPNVPEDEKCNVTVSIASEQYSVITLTEANFIGEQVRIPLIHQNEQANLHFLKNGTVYKVEQADIDVSAETEILISNVDWLVGEVIDLVFITNVSMGIAKRVFINVTTQAQGADFFRTVKVNNSSIVTEGILESNVWRSSSLDLSYTIDTIISAINEAIPDTDEPA